MNANMITFKRVSQDAQIPTKGTKGSAGYDLYAAHNAVIEPHGKALVSTDLIIEIPEGYYGRIAPRSSLAWKNHIDVGAGVIDSDYRGVVGVILFNLDSTQTFKVNKGDRIAQLIIEKYYDFELKEVEEISTTQREGGFGSTGL